jgi:dUTP pyrophosphatase
MTSIQIKIVNTSANPLPQYATKGASGMDIRASLDIPLTLQPLERNLIPQDCLLKYPRGTKYK